MDPIAQFKEGQKAAWSSFVPMETATASVAPALVRFANITKGMRVLDVGSGTGVVAITAARAGAKVTGVDLTPELVARAKENASIANVDVIWHEGDAEALPLPDATFDVVVSQFGHMFAPRPAVVTKEMLRVLKPGGTVAFSTWPPHLFVGRFFSLVGSYAPPPPDGVQPPSAWGDPNVVRERLGAAVKDLVFRADRMAFQALSPQHVRVFVEATVGPLGKVVARLSDDPAKLKQLRSDVEELVTSYFHDNHVVEDFLLSRATKI